MKIKAKIPRKPYNIWKPSEKVTKTPNDLL